MEKELIQFGIVLPSYMYDATRLRLAADALVSLARTESLQQKPRLLLLVKDGRAHEYTQFLEGLQRSFNVIVKTDAGLAGTEQTLAFGTTWLLENYGVTHVIWMGDDALFHPMWLWQLEGLIRRHPDAKSWSVYRSSFEFVHRTLEERGEDVLVRSICGHGMTFSRTEWKDWGIDWEKEQWDQEGDTLDLLHFFDRPGERWVTKDSYVEHTGKVGVHCHEGIPEYARNFQMA